MGNLEKEVKLDYSRTMNSINFDKVVMTHRQQFMHIKLPQKEPKCVPKTGKPTVHTFIFVPVRGRSKKLSRDCK